MVSNALFWESWNGKLGVVRLYLTPHEGICTDVGETVRAINLLYHIETHKYGVATITGTTVACQLMCPVGHSRWDSNDRPYGGMMSACLQRPTGVSCLAIVYGVDGVN